MIHDFYENEFIKEFVIFPLNQKQSKGKLSTTGIEEVKGQTEIPQSGTIKLSPNDTYYLFKYFSSIKDEELSQLLVISAGVDPQSATLSLNSESLKISVNTSMLNFKKIAKRMKEII